MANTVSAMMIVVPRSGSLKIKNSGNGSMMSIWMRNARVSMVPSSK
ncbi:Uncharacterised protein [Collinsella intestinalis]|nr:Uncharacterised protein [Collinsella intestinalis]